MKFKIIIFSIFLFSYVQLRSQGEQGGKFSGNFETNVNFYERDDRIGANTEVYKKAKSSVDAWLFLNYELNGFQFSARFDGFQNSPLLNPQGMYTKQGLGFWQVSKTIDKYQITAGYFYEQFGSGMLFRAYEDRNIGIDFAIQGVKVKANLNENLRLKVFSGQQKGNILTGDRFDVTPQVLTGMNLEQRVNIKNVTLDLGASAINKVLDNATLNRLVSDINALPLESRFLPKYNTYSFNGYGTMQYKNLSVYGEYCYKTPEAIFDLNNNMYNSDGNIIFGSASYSAQGIGKKKKSSIGMNTQYKRIDNFRFRTTPYETLLNGMVSYLPSITRQNTYRLLARYNSVVQEQGEQAFQADVVFTPAKGTTFIANASYVESLRQNGLNNTPQKLYHELYFEVQHKFKRNDKGQQWAVKGGVQNIFYNQDVYEVKPGAKNVRATTPFAEVTYKFKKTKSFRLETQYLETKQDLGSFINLILEYNMAPHWSFAVGDMVNHKPYRSANTTVSDEIIHYYSAFVGYTQGATKVTIAYIKQVEGVNCTGGICRVEPAFSGLRVNMSSSF